MLAMFTPKGRFQSPNKAAGAFQLAKEIKHVVAFRFPDVHSVIFEAGLKRPEAVTTLVDVDEITEVVDAIVRSLPHKCGVRIVG